jgi:hypothetical protein
MTPLKLGLMATTEHGAIMYHIYLKDQCLELKDLTIHIEAVSIFQTLLG